MTLLLAGCGEPSRPGTPPEHVLLVTLEALRADHCSAFGYPRRTTFLQRLGDERALDIDRLAETGVSFANAFAPALDPGTSLRALMRSQSALDASAAAPGPTLAQLFGAAGYACAALLVPAESLADEARRLGFEPVQEFLASPLEREPERAAFAAAREWIAARLAAGERFLLWIHLARPAPPFDAPPLADEYSRPDDGEGGSARDAYDGELALTNALLCEFLESLETLDGAPLSRAVVALCGVSGVALPPSDAGPRLDEAHLHVPLVLRHPASLTGRRIEAEVVELADLAPTLLEWLGVDLSAPLAGRSLLPLVDSYVERPFERRPALAVRGASSSVRDERWRLVREADESALYDVARDPEQRLDLADEEPQVHAALEAMLRDRLRPGAGP